MVYVTLGTMHLGFPRLVHAVDAFARDFGERVVVQLGLGATIPSHCEHFAFRSREEVLALQREARVIVAHAGIGSVIDALEVGRPLIVVPRLKRLGEHTTEHQMDLARAVERRGWGRMIADVNELHEALANPPPVREQYKPWKDGLIASVRDFVNEVAGSQVRRLG
jgi:UDP-N-acetylglucosamine transferase subunit ALG13